jgi:hypothetical protein
VYVTISYEVLWTLLEWLIVNRGDPSMVLRNPRSNGRLKVSGFFVKEGI